VEHERIVTADVFEPEHDEKLDAAIFEGLRIASLNVGAAAYLCDLQRMRFGQWRSREAIYPASVIKVPIMTEAFHRIAQGALSADDRVTVQARNQTATSGPAPFSTGTSACVGDLVDHMIVHSDNVATNELIDLLERERVTAYMHALGLSTFFLGRKLSGSEPFVEDPDSSGRNRLPPAEIGRLLALIATDVVPGAAQQRAILARCADDEKLAPGLASGDTFMHKTGETETVSHDAGILLTKEGRRYIVVLYCEVEGRPDHAEAAWVNPMMTAWMRSVREHL
jgi:beta-lactamase class A